MALEKAMLTNTVTGERIPVMFNPEEYTLSRDVNYAQTAVPGLSAPLVQFVAGNQRTLELELLVDTYEAHQDGSRILNQAGDDVRDLTRKVTDLLEIEPSTHAPPVVIFVWGTLSFTCVLTRVTQRFLMFLADGTPVRARLQLSMSEFRNVDLEAKEIKRETADYSKRHQVVEGETLASISWREYGTPGMWRPIALCNRVANPRRLNVGQQLVLPRLPYRHPDTGEVFA